MSESDKSYRIELQSHLLEICKQVLAEHSKEIIERAEKRILALKTFYQHDQA